MQICGSAAMARLEEMSTRDMKGVYQHCAAKHLHRYLCEFDFRYLNRATLGADDAAHADKALQGAAGKRLTLLQTHRSTAMISTAAQFANWINGASESRTDS